MPRPIYRVWKKWFFLPADFTCMSYPLAVASLTRCSEPLPNRGRMADDFRCGKAALVRLVSDRRMAHNRRQVTRLLTGVALGLLAGAVLAPSAARATCGDYVMLGGHAAHNGKTA